MIFLLILIKFYVEAFFQREKLNEFQIRGIVPPVKLIMYTRMLT